MREVPGSAPDRVVVDDPCGLSGEEWVVKGSCTNSVESGQLISVNATDEDRTVDEMETDFNKISQPVVLASPGVGWENWSFSLPC